MLDKIFVIGIDPGKNGGIVSLTNGKITTIDPMPSNIESTIELFLSLLYPKMERIKTYVFRENVHSMPTDGVKGAFTFGYHVGMLDTILLSMDIKPLLVNPREWQKAAGIQPKLPEETKYTFKKRLLESAHQASAERYHSRLTLKTADAYLIAKYGYQQIKEKEKSNNDML